MVKEIKCLIDTTEYKMLTNFKVEQSLGYISLSTFKVQFDQFTQMVKCKSRVKITWGDYIIFYGKVEKVKSPELHPNNSAWIMEVTCQPINSVFSDRIISESFINSNVYEVINNLLDNYGDSENIITSRDGFDKVYYETIPVEKVVFNDWPLYRCIDEIAKSAKSIWTITPTGTFIFKTNEDYVSNEIIINDIEEYSFNNLKLDSNTNNMRNSQIISGYQEETTEQIEQFKGDGVNKNFNVNYRLRQKPKLFVNEVEVSQALIKETGEEEATTEWVWTRDSVTITKNKTPQLGTSDILLVKYFGFVNRKLSIENTESISEIKTRSGGSGLIEMAIVDKSIESQSFALDIARDMIDKYGEPESNLNWFMFSDSKNIESFNLATKLTFNLPSLGLEYTFKIFGVVITASNYSKEDGWILKYEFKASTQTKTGDASIIKKLDDYRITLLVNEDAVAIKEFSNSDSFSYSEYLRVIQGNPLFLITIDYFETEHTTTCDNVQATTNTYSR